MSTPELRILDRAPLISLVDRASRALSVDMVREARGRGYPFIRLAHNSVFATLMDRGGRISDMAARAGITKQSMGEVVRELLEHGVLEVSVDPDDRRAKVVSYTEYGLEVTNGGRLHLESLERLFVEEFGEADYEAARRVLEGVVALLAPQEQDARNPDEAVGVPD
jgi:DNA-binding MarR family transcriptional regulator